MDAKVRRAALATAMKVTITSTLLGCGGTTTDPSSGAIAGPPPPAMPGGASPSTVTPGGTSSTQAEVAGAAAVTSGGASAGGTAAASAGGASTGGVSQGGALAQGGTNEAGAPTDGGAAGSPAGLGGEAGAPGGVCSAEAYACMDSLEALGLMPGQQLPDDPAAKACCQLVAAAIGVTTIDPCKTELLPRFSPVRTQCCTALLWTGTGCTAWGPPVPPELTTEALLAWSNAA